MKRVSATSDQTAMVVAAFTVCVIVAGAVVLLLAGVDPATYVVILAGPAVSGLVGLLLSKRVTDVQVLGEENRARAVRIEAATNGPLTARFDNIDESLADATVQRSAHAADAADAAAATVRSREP